MRSSYTLLFLFLYTANAQLDALAKKAVSAPINPKEKWALLNIYFAGPTILWNSN